MTEAESRDLLHWAVGLEQRRRMLFVLKAEVTAQRVQLTSADAWYACV